MLFGLITPLFAIHSNTSCYRGDLADLTQLIELISSIGGNYLQLLPLQDTNGIDSPYSTDSWFAMDIRYLYVEGLATTSPLTLKEQIARKREKMELLYQQNKKSEAFLSQLSHFRKSNPWVFPYACFKTLQTKFPDRPSSEWDAPYNVGTPEVLKLVESTHLDGIQLEIFIQMSCFLQLGKAAEQAKKWNVQLCCDLPHFCKNESVEGWSNPTLFLPNTSVGAPPDPLAPNGQNWNLAPWNWEKNPEGVLQLWQDRNRLFSSYFSYARVDHVIGLFRQWVINKKEKGFNGAFRPSELKDALSLGANTLSKLNTPPMQLVAENLGTIPPEVNQVLNNLHILGTIVWRWNRYWHIHDAPYIPLNQMNESNLVSFTTHDTTTLEGWAESDPSAFEMFCKTYNLPLDTSKKLPKISPELRLHFFYLLRASPCRIKAEMIEEFLLLQEGFGYPDPEKQQVNNPMDLSKPNWTYRCIPSLETLQGSAPWREKMEKIIASNKG